MHRLRRQVGALDAARCRAAIGTERKRENNHLWQRHCGVKFPTSSVGSSTKPRCTVTSGGSRKSTTSAPSSTRRSRELWRGQGRRLRHDDHSRDRPRAADGGARPPFPLCAPRQLSPRLRHARRHASRRRRDGPRRGDTCRTRQREDEGASLDPLTSNRCINRAAPRPAAQGRWRSAAPARSHLGEEAGGHRMTAPGRMVEIKLLQ